MAKKDNKNTAPHVKTSTFLNFSEGSYLASTSSPLYALLFLLPLIIIYEAGIMVNINLEQSRFVAAFAWLMSLAQWLGVHRNLAWAFPGLVVVIILLCWHLSSDYPWRIRIDWLGWMTLESILLSLPLFAIAAITSSQLTPKKHSPRYTQYIRHSQSSQTIQFARTCNTYHTDNDITLYGHIKPLPAITRQAATRNNNYSCSVLTRVLPKGYAANLITSIGAGIYEELIFRLVIFGLLLIILEDILHIKTPMATAAAVLVSAVLFAAHHYVGINTANIYSYEEKFQLGSFAFRLIAGIYFAIIFRYRGYGIAAGAHIAYDIIYFTLR